MEEKTEHELALKAMNDEYGQACAELGHEIFRQTLYEEQIEQKRLKVFNLNNKIKKHLEKAPKPQIVPQAEVTQ